MSSSSPGFAGAEPVVPDVTDAPLVQDGSAERPSGGAAPAPSLLKNVGHLLSSQVVTWILATAVQIMIPTFLGPAGVGRLRLATAVWAMGAIFVSLGTSRLLKLEIAKDRARGERLVGPIIAVRLAAFAVLSALLAVVGAVSGVDLEASLIFVAVGIGVLINTVSETWTSALLGLERVGVAAQAAILAKVAYTATVVTVLLAGGGPVAVAVCSVAGSVVAFVVLRHGYRRFGRTAFTDVVAVGRMAVRASLAFLGMALAIVVYQQIDTVVIALLVDSTTLGWYSVADTFFGTLLFFPVITVTVIVPRLGRLHVEDPGELRMLSRQAFGTQTLVAVPIGLGTAVVAHRVVPMLFGDEYRESGPVLAVLGIVLILTCGTILMGGIANATDRTRQWNYLMVGAIILSVPLDLVLVPLCDRRFGNGAIGGALAYVVTEFLILAAGFRWFAPFLISRTTLLRTAKILAAGGAMAATAWPFRDQVAVAVAVGGVVYVAAVVGLRTLDDVERRAIRRITRRLKPSV